MVTSLEILELFEEAQHLGRRKRFDASISVCRPSKLLPVEEIDIETERKAARRSLNRAIEERASRAPTIEPEERKRRLRAYGQRWRNTVTKEIRNLRDRLKTDPRYMRWATR